MAIAVKNQQGRFELVLEAKVPAGPDAAELAGQDSRGLYYYRGRIRLATDRSLLGGQPSELDRLQLQARVWEPAGEGFLLIV